MRASSMNVPEARDNFKKEKIFLESIVRSCVLDNHGHWDYIEGCLKQSMMSMCTGVSYNGDQQLHALKKLQMPLGFACNTQSQSLSFLELS